MKKFFVGCLAMMCLSAFAVDKSEFEKGFYEGKNSCEESYYTCSVETGANNYDGSPIQLVSDGISRAKRIEELMKDCKSLDYPDYQKACAENIRHGNVRCQKL